MDLLQLEHFLAVVEERTFTRAAERVCRTQPAVSQSIRKLEEEIGSPLFARDVHDVTLTDAGKLLVEHARRMVTARNDALREVTSLKGPAADTLTIAADETAAVYLLPDTVRQYLHRFPNMRISFLPTQPSDIQRHVLNRDAHVGFVKDHPEFRDLQSTELYLDALIVVTSPRNPLATRLCVPLADLGAESFVVHQLSHADHGRVTGLFHAQGFHCQVVADLGSFENVKSFVAAGIGLAVVPAVTVQRELVDGTLVRLHVPELALETRTFMIHRDRRYLSDAAREFVTMAQSLCSHGKARDVRTTSIAPVTTVMRGRAAAAS